MKPGTWVEEYYQVLEFLYWEPQHLGKQTKPDSPWANRDRAMRHVREMEVTLNHQLNILFSLLPMGLRQNLIEFLTGRKPNGPIGVNSRAVRSMPCFQGNVTQPDLLFSDDGALWAIEMKVKAKTDLQQLAKYFLFAALESEGRPSPKKFALGFLGPGPMESLFKEGFASLDLAREELLKGGIPDVLGGTATAPHWATMEVIAASATLTFRTFKGLNEFLNTELAGLDPGHVGTESLALLIGGFQAELRSRTLI